MSGAGNGVVTGQLEQLVKMANQIALNMGAWGSEEAVAEHAAQHMESFWTPQMRRQLQEYWRAGGAELSAVVELIMTSREWSA